MRRWVGRWQQVSPVLAKPCSLPEVASCGALLQYHPKDLVFDRGPVITFNAATTMARNVHWSTFAGDVGLLPDARRPRLVWTTERLKVVNAWHIHFWASDALLPAPTLVTRVFPVASRHAGLAPKWPEPMERERRCLVRCAPAIRIDGRVRCWSSALGGAGSTRYATPMHDQFA